ncbi:MAG TPA: YggS family pyridoxal phosphate-dependent enzyme [Solibacterales bacterium]|nr:YggS family pyridoxal phosphate-dependent enzyme [Bryobacterales bacterium]
MAIVLIDRLRAVEDRIVRAAARAGRTREDIALIAVTKVFSASAIQDAYALGLREFGENYVQEFERKEPEVRALAGARIHMIGHLQSNKAKRAAELFHCVQTVDSIKLARRLNEGERPLDVFLEVKLSGEESKAGAAPEELPALIEGVRGCANLRLRGLMTMPPWSEEAETARPYFARLRELAARHGLPGLSMGMSNDFEVAIAEGATHIRVGTALFGPRKRA